MELKFVNYDDLGYSQYIVYPGGPIRRCYEESIITILRDDPSEESVKAILADPAFAAMVEEQRLVLNFPNPKKGGWKSEPSGYGLSPDAQTVRNLTQKVFAFSPMPRGSGTKWRWGEPPAFTGVPRWHIMHNARYLAGEGGGAAVAQELAAVYPINIGAVMTVGGGLAPKVAENSVNAPTAAALWNAPQETVEFFKKLNECDTENDGVCFNADRPAQRVIAMDKPGAKLDGAALVWAWDNMFSKVTRINADYYGDLEERVVKTDYKYYVVHEDENILGDGLEHTWFEYVPQIVRDHPEKPVPVVMFCHGGSDTPGNVVNMVRLDKVADQEGFIYVIPWSSNKFTWNQNMQPDLVDDAGYLEKLFRYVQKQYNVDAGKLFIGGFSNGCGMAQAFAMTHPDMIAGVFADDTRSFQNRNTPNFLIAGKKKCEYDYRMPIWYCYGSRDMEFPAVRGSGQQEQYDFWKAFNNIEIKETPYMSNPDVCGSGVPGQRVEVYTPNPKRPHRRYITNRFYTDDPSGWNLYSYSIAFGKGHDVNPEECWLAWDYLKHYRRNADGSVSME